ncbi:MULTISPECIES: DUF305 domain-containing protein [Larkinella]|uniref:DUF305 domain-containing protein n=1 Tax=Larkinella punicea TaxID=2315727 RepID=A0A368JHE2_9BACT|nr:MULTISPECIES: DUF305 domain-containing protein [Larkinella]RCR67089.1 DUF305 domain-containing protein [Larkinella punicea]
MKKRFFAAAGISLALVLAHPAVAQQGQHAGHKTTSPASGNTLMKAMQSGMDKMMSMKMTGDPDHDFAMMMLLHHQSAVDMADLELKKGQNTQVKMLASKIKAANQKEIENLTQFIGSHKPQSASSAFGKDAMKIMHSGNHTMNGKVDHDFASMMAQHHQQGVDMARAFLKEGKTEKMQTMASNVVKMQTKEIDELKRLEASLR